LNIAVNTRLLLKNQMEGIGRFTFEIFSRLTKNNPEHHFYFFFDRPFHPDFIFSENVTPIVIYPPARHPFLIHFWYNTSVPYYLKKYNIDVFISPDGIGTLMDNIKQILVIHDLNFYHYPKHLPFLYSWYYRYFTPKFIACSNRLVAVSQFTKSDIQKMLPQAINIPIDVVPNAVDTCFIPSKNQQLKDNIRRKYANGSSYFLYVGSINPRKNVLNLVKAFCLFKQQTHSDMKLLIVGKNRWSRGFISKELQESPFKKEVVFLDSIDDNELILIYQSAFCFCYLSIFEGFGIPILEAMSCGVPVITSNVTAIPEIAGDAACLVNPFSIEEIANALQKMCSDNDFYQSLSLRGIDRAQMFSWDVAADKFWQSIIKMNLD
jgi:glycosyltransferase involved in cell wall biosynthesis